MSADEPVDVAALEVAGLRRMYGRLWATMSSAGEAGLPGRMPSRHRLEITMTLSVTPRPHPGCRVMT
jgi:hypothetical protein